jgi:hypothetical protein
MANSTRKGLAIARPAPFAAARTFSVSQRYPIPRFSGQRCKLNREEKQRTHYLAAWLLGNEKTHGKRMAETHGVTSQRPVAQIGGKRAMIFEKRDRFW